MTAKRLLRVFISSPGDVRPERDQVRLVTERLQNEFEQLEIEPVLWEEQHYTADTGFQEQIPEPRDCDLFILILWKRIGWPLNPEKFQRPDGTSPTGTEYEFEQALAAFEQKGSPEILAYCKTAQVQYDADKVDDQKQQHEDVEAAKQRWFHNKHGHYTGAYNTFDCTEAFVEMLEKDLRHWLKSHAIVHWPAEKGSPFRGLLPFEAEHEAVFFGRKAALNELSNLILGNANQHQTNNFMLVIGSSGCGKSSLIRAGLIPRFDRECRLHASLVTSPQSLGEKPLLGLTEALFKTLPDLADCDHPTESDLAEFLADAPQYAAKPIEAVFNRNNPSDQRVLLILLDQFEEIFQWPDGIRQSFLAVIETLCASEKVIVVATLRSDFYPKVIDDEQLHRLRANNRQYDLAPLREHELKEIIEAPVAAAGLRFEQDSHGHWLNRTLLDEAADQANVLPLLEFTLDRLYQLHDKPEKQLTFSAYQSLGGLNKAISEHAAKVLRTIDNGEATLKGLLPKLIEVDHQQNIRRKPAIAEALTQAQTTLANTLIDARLLTSADTGITLVHDSLLTEWPSVQNWIESNIDFIRWLPHIQHQTDLWLKENKAKDRLLGPGKPLEEAKHFLQDYDDALSDGIKDLITVSISKVHKTRLRNWSLASIFVLGLVAATVYSLYQQSIALAQAEIARQEKAKADEQTQIAQAEKAKSDEILDQVKQTVSFMNYDLRDVLRKYTPLTERLAVTKQIDELVDLLKNHGDDDLLSKRNRATALLQKAEIALTSTSADLTTALTWAKEAHDIFTELSAQYPSNSELQRDLSVSFIKIGNILEKQGQINEALASYQQALAIRERLTQLDPANNNWRRDLSVSYTKIGNVQEELGQTNEALTSHQQALAINDGLAQLDPVNSQWQRDLSVSYSNIGIVQEKLGQINEALASYQQALAISETLAQLDPANSQWQQDLSVSYGNIGDIQQKLGQINAALVSYQQFLSIHETLTQLDPANSKWQRDLSVSYNKIGNAQHKLGQTNEALASYQQALAIRETLTQLDPTNSQWQLDLARSKVQLSLAYFKNQQIEKMLPLVVEARDIFVEQSQRNPLVPRDQGALDNLNKILALVEEAGLTP